MPQSDPARDASQTNRWTLTPPCVMIHSMVGVVLIDGNNLLYAMHEHGPTRPVGRIALVRMIEHWATQEQATVCLVFDGPPPRGGLAKQIASNIIEIIFSGSRKADDLIMDRMEQERSPASVTVVTSDNAIRHEAGHRHCRCLDNVTFIQRLFESRVRGSPVQPSASQSARRPTEEKPTSVSPDEKQHWIDLFEGDGESENIR